MKRFVFRQEDSNAFCSSKKCEIRGTCYYSMYNRQYMNNQEVGSEVIIEDFYDENKSCYRFKLWKFQ